VISRQTDAGSTGASIYRRTLGARLLAVVGAALFVSGAVSRMILSGFGVGLLVIGGLAILSLVNLVTAWGDRVILDDDGIEQRNVLLAAIGVGPRRVAWVDIMGVGEPARMGALRRDGSPRALLLVPRSGKRLMLDSLERFDDIVKEVRRRVPQAQ
jgi:hypothetical protein